MSEPSEDSTKHREHTTADQTGSIEVSNLGSQLAQRIWDRYGYSPGVIPMKTVRGMARRVTRASSGRLSLGAELQRRWVFSVSSGSSDPVSPVHIEPPAVNSVSRTLQSLPEKQASEGTNEAHSLAARSSTEFEPAIIRRHKSSFTEQAFSRQVATHVPAPAAGEVPAPQENIPLPQSSAAPIGSTSPVQNPTPIKRGIGAPEKIVLQRHLSNPLEEAGPHRDSPRGMSRLKLPLMERPISNTVVEATPVIQTHRTTANPLEMPLATSAPTSYSTLIQAQETPAPSPGPSASAPAATQPTTGTTGAVDTTIEHNTNDEQDLVDRVLRQLMRRLAIESERRGRQRWP